jgi:hypothetical protein
MPGSPTLNESHPTFDETAGRTWGSVKQHRASNATPSSRDARPRSARPKRVSVAVLRVVLKLRYLIRTLWSVQRNINPRRQFWSCAPGGLSADNPAGLSGELRNMKADGSGFYRSLQHIFKMRLPKDCYRSESRNGSRSSSCSDSALCS